MDDESKLIENAKCDVAAFGALYDRHVDRIFGYAWRETGDEALAQDVTAATFEYALQHIGRYEQRGVPFSAWLYRIARSEIAGHYRKRKWLQPWRPQLERISVDPQLEQKLQAQFALRRVHDGVAKLSQRDQEIIRLHFFEQLTHAEIGAVLQCSTRNVAVRLHRAIGRLQREVNDG